MTPKIREYITTAIADRPHVPDLREYLVGLDIDPAEFTAWLADEIGKYDVLVAIRRGRLSGKERRPVTLHNPRPPLSAEKHDLNDLVQALRATGMRTNPRAIPPRTRKTLDDAYGPIWRDACAEVGEAVKKLLAMLDPVQATVETRPSEKGRPSTAPRDSLLAAVVSKLKQAGANEKDARGLTEQIFIACHIPTPSGERSTRRATTRTKERSRDI